MAILFFGFSLFPYVLKTVALLVLNSINNDSNSQLLNTYTLPKMEVQIKREPTCYPKVDALYKPLCSHMTFILVRTSGDWMPPVVGFSTYFARVFHSKSPKKSGVVCLQYSRPHRIILSVSELEIKGYPQ